MLFVIFSITIAYTEAVIKRQPVSGWLASIFLSFLQTIGRKD